MRWRIRTQMLSPVVLLLAGVALISCGTAWAAARQARRQIEDRQRNVARVLALEPRFPLTDYVLRLLQQLSGAQYVLEPAQGQRRTSLEVDPGQLAVACPIADDWKDLHLGAAVSVAGRTYLC